MKNKKAKQVKRTKAGQRTRTGGVARKRGRKPIELVKSIPARGKISVIALSNLMGMLRGSGNAYVKFWCTKHDCYNALSLDPDSRALMVNAGTARKIWAYRNTHKL